MVFRSSSITINEALCPSNLVSPKPHVPQTMAPQPQPLAATSPLSCRLP